MDVNLWQWAMNASAGKNQTMGVMELVIAWYTLNFIANSVITRKNKNLWCWFFGHNEWYQGSSGDWLDSGCRNRNCDYKPFILKRINREVQKIQVQKLPSNVIVGPWNRKSG